MMCSFFFSSRRRHTRCYRDWSSDVCSSDLKRRQGRRRGRSPMKRTVQVYGAVAAIALVGALAGCGSSSNDSGSAATTTSTPSGSASGSGASQGGGGGGGGGGYSY